MKPGMPADKRGRPASARDRPRLGSAPRTVRTGRRAGGEYGPGRPLGLGHTDGVGVRAARWPGAHGRRAPRLEARPAVPAPPRGEASPGGHAHPRSNSLACRCYRAPPTPSLPAEAQRARSLRRCRRHGRRSRNHAPTPRRVHRARHGYQLGWLRARSEMRTRHPPSVRSATSAQKCVRFCLNRTFPISVKRERKLTLYRRGPVLVG